MRDKRFVAVHRGGPLRKEHHYGDGLDRDYNCLFQHP